MRIIDRKYTDLARGFARVRELDASLREEKREAVLEALKHKYTHDVRDWKRNTVILYVSSFIGVALYVISFWLPEWNLLLTIFLLPALFSLLLALGIVRWKWLPNFVRPVQGTPEEIFPNQATLWWNNLYPPRQLIVRPGDVGERAFMTELSANLPDAFIAMQRVLTSARMVTDTDILVIGPSGIWIFEVKHWKGYILLEKGVWRQARPVVEGGELVYDNSFHETAPDEQWLEQKQQISKTIEKRLASERWVTDFIFGGIVFTHSEAMIDKARIVGSKAMFDRPDVWLKRILQSNTEERFTTEVQLKVLDALQEYALLHEKEALSPVSTIEVAERIYAGSRREVEEFIAAWESKPEPE